MVQAKDGLAADQPIPAQPPANNSSLWLLSGLVPPLGLVVAIYLWLVKKARRLALLTLGLAIAASLFYGYIYHQRSLTNNYNYNYRYSNLTPTNVPPVQPGSGANFQRPSQFSSPSTLVYPLLYQHAIKGHLVGELAFTNSSASPRLAKALASLTTTGLAKASSDSDYKNAAAPINQFTKASLPPGFSFSLSHAASLTTPNLKTNAWQFGLTVHDPKDSKTPTWQGQVDYVWGQTGSYYMLITTIQPNWTPNAQTWQQVVNSLKVDQ